MISQKQSQTSKLEDIQEHTNQLDNRSEILSIHNVILEQKLSGKLITTPRKSDLPDRDELEKNEGGSPTILLDVESDLDNSRLNAGRPR